MNVTDSGAFSDYHALQLEVRRRLSRGLTVNANYQYAREGGSAFLGLHDGRAMDPVDNVRHAIKAQWDWTIPVGRGQRYGTDMNAWANGFLGGWQFSGATRMQARMMDMGGVRLVGMTLDELEDLYEFRIIDDPVNAGQKLVTMLPADIILNTQRAFNTSATSRHRLRRAGRAGGPRTSRRPTARTASNWQQAIARPARCSFGRRGSSAWTSA